MKQVRGGLGDMGDCYASGFDVIHPRCLTEQPSDTWYPQPGPHSHVPIVTPPPPPSFSGAAACDRSDPAIHRGFACGFEHRCGTDDMHHGDNCGFWLDFSLGNHTANGGPVTTRSYAQGMLAQLKANRWIDEYTRFVYVDASLYNNNHRMWARVSLTFNFHLSGDILESAKIHAVALDPYDLLNEGIAPTNWFRFLLEVFFCLLVVDSVASEVREFRSSDVSVIEHIRSHGWLYKLFDLLGILLNITVLFLWVAFVVSPTRRNLADQARDSPTYIELGWLVAWSNHYNAVNALNVIVRTIRSVKFFQVLSCSDYLVYALHRMIPKIMSFLPIFMMVVLGYAAAGQYLYGMKDPAWESYAESIYNVWQLNFGLFDTTAHLCRNCNNSVGASIFNFSAMVVISTILMNVFLAIVMATYSDREEFEINKAHLQPVPQSLWSHDLPMLLSVPRRSVLNCIALVAGSALTNDGLCVCVQLD